MADSKQPKRATRSAKTLTDPPKSRQTKAAESKAKKTTAASAAKKAVKAPAAAKKPVAKKEATAKRAQEPEARSKMDMLIQKNSLSAADAHALIEKKAYEIFASRGYESGRDFDHWIEAERQVLQKTQ